MANINNLFPSKYLKASDFTAGPQNAVMATIAMEAIDEGHDPKPVLYFQGQNKGLVLNKTNGQMIAHIYGPETDAWIDKHIQLYVEPVSFQGRIVDAIRVRAPAPPAATQPMIDGTQVHAAPPAPKQAPPAPGDVPLEDIPW